MMLAGKEAFYRPHRQPGDENAAETGWRVVKEERIRRNT